MKRMTVHYFPLLAEQAGTKREVVTTEATSPKDLFDELRKAPGVRIPSITEGGIGWTLYQGTSFSAAHVTGTLALYLARGRKRDYRDGNPTLLRNEILTQSLNSPGEKGGDKLPPVINAMMKPKIDVFNNLERNMNE